MNINGKELLLLNNKKIKFGENQESGNSSIVAETGVPNVKIGMNALTAQGLNNVIANPKLAQNIGVMREDAPQTVQSAENYIAPYKSNIAFQGGKFKNMAMAAMMAIMTLGGAATTFSSCKNDPEIYKEIHEGGSSVVVNIDMTAIANLVSEIKALREEMAQRDEANAEKYDQLLTMMNTIVTLMNDQKLTNDKFQSLFLANQEVIIDLLVAQGMKQDDANAKLDKIYDEVKNGNITAQQALQQIIALLGDIKSMLSEAIADFTAYYEKMIAKQDELIEANKAGFKELVELGKISDAKLDKIIAQNNALIEYSAKASEERIAIKEAIEKANFGGDADFSTIVETLNINKDELIKALQQMGCSMSQIINMSKDEIIAAINKNTEMTEKGNNLLSQISCQLTILPKLLEEGKITNEEIKKLYQAFNNISFPEGGEGYSPEVITKLEELLAKLDGIQNTLNEILKKVDNIAQDFSEFRTDYNQNKIKEFELMNTVIQENKIQTSILENMKQTQNDMEVNLIGIKKNTDNLIEIVKDDSKYKELLDAIKNIDININTELDADALKAMFKQMGIELADVLKMSQADLLAAIKKFEQTYIDTEAKNIEQLKSINSKLDDIKCFNAIAKDEILAAIKDIEISGGNGDVTINADLSKIEAKLDKVIDLLTNELKEISSQISKVNTYLSQFDSKWNSILDMLENFDSKLNTIISNQTISHKYLENLLEEVKNLKAEIKNFQVSTGCEGITPEELEAMWQKHDEANYNRFKALLEGLDINSCDHSTIENLLASIDAKLNAQKDYSDILNQILNKLNGIDLTNEQLTEIKELLKNFKCNCQCGGNNEGVLGDLDNILG